MTLPGNIKEQLRKRIKVDPITGCWIWRKSRNRGGYGQISIGGTMRKAHRVSYEAHVGPIPESLQVDHLCHRPQECAGGPLCRHRRCINPEHLQVCTRRVNILRGCGVTAQNANKSHCANGHEFSADNTYITKRGGRTCRICQLALQRLWYSKHGRSLNRHYDTVTMDHQRRGRPSSSPD